MATEIERVTAIIGALRNDTATAQMLENIAVLCINARLAQILDAGLDPDNLTTQQKARVILDTLQTFLRGKFKNEQRDILYKDSINTIISAGSDIDEVIP